MNYSRELINEVKELYPDSKEMNKLAKNGGTFLGRYLDDSSSNMISVDTVLAATSLDDLQKKARHAKRKLALYNKWGEEYDLAIKNGEIK